MARRSNREEILNQAIQQFAAAGYAGVSMRDIARTCELNVGSLYHHFNDKQQLYLAAVQQAFAGRAARLLAVLESPEPATERLMRLIEVLCQLLGEDQTFSRLIQREVIDGDEERLKQLAEQVFGQLIAALNRLCQQLNPRLDPALLACSVIGLVLHLFQYAALHRHLPGYHPEHEQPEIIRQHIQQLLCQGLISPPSSRGSA
ncbi:MAG: TetR/AcrR family transcriptional regulator [Deltaproteobacteria bacterium]|nr:TetR/AcrR family transcriptional regulator [Deltaproteobacteria bacterium]